jgi:hypothetical protein
LFLTAVERELWPEKREKREERREKRRESRETEVG